MKNIFICLILLSTIFSYKNTGYSGMYFSEGFTLSGSYSNQQEDGDNSSALGLGFSYLAVQKEVDSSDRPTLFQSGIFEINGFYNSIDSDDLNMKMLTVGLGYYLNNLKFGLDYETLSDYSGDDVDFLNEVSNNTFEMSGSSTMFSIGVFEIFKMTHFDCIPFLDLMTVKSELSMSYTLGNISEVTLNDDGSANLLRLGVGFKMNNIVIQPTVVLNEDKEKRYSITAIFGL